MNLVAPYPGHQYCDDLIEDKMRGKSSNLSQEEITAIALNSLTDAGFKGFRSYRKFPNDDMRWIINHYEHTVHVTKMVNILLDCGADNNTATRRRGLLVVAAEKGNLALTKLLLERNATVNPEELMDNSERLVGPRRQRLQEPREMFKNIDNGEENPLRAALLNDHILICHILLRGGADVNRVEKKDGNRTPLHNAVLRHDTLYEHVPLLLAHGASLEPRNVNGNTPLYVAVAQNHHHAVRALLESGADVNAVNKYGRKPLSAVIATGGGRDNSERYNARFGGWLSRYFKSDDTDELVRCLSAYGGDVHAPCADVGAPCALFWAFETSNVAVAQLLIDDYSALYNMHQLSSQGNGGLHFLACLHDESAGPIMDRMIECARELNIQNAAEETPLHFTASYDNVLYAKKLVESKAITSILNKAGDTPLAIARRRWNSSTLKEVFGLSAKGRWWK